MSKAIMLSVLTSLLLSHSSSVIAQPSEKPRTRATAEDKTTNLNRYKIGGFGESATETLGIKVVYPNNTQQGITVSSFEIDSKAEEAGLEQYDWILEVDGSPVGFIRGRYYEPWQKYGRSGPGKTEVLVTYLLPPSGERLYYYPKITTQSVAPVYRDLPDDFFTTRKPRDRTQAENATHNKARYKLGYGNFDKYSRWELGAFVDYSYGSGATIKEIILGKAAEKAGLKVGDMILEVDGAPIGVFNERTYEVWRQFVYSKNGNVELLIAFKESNGTVKYFYPTVQLDERTTPN